MDAEYGAVKVTDSLTGAARYVAAEQVEEVAEVVKRDRAGLVMTDEDGKPIVIGTTITYRSGREIFVKEDAIALTETLLNG